MCLKPDHRSRRTHTFKRFVAALASAGLCRHDVLLTEQAVPRPSSTPAPARGCGKCCVQRLSGVSRVYLWFQVLDRTDSSHGSGAPSAPG